ncbi:MAG TPA: hypothetical protein VEH53_02350, partial [archaeon]|nr:hypothetical protein [archaeon]
VFLTARTADGDVSSIRFSYYKDPGPTGRRTDGPGTDSAPTLTLTDLVQLLEKLGALGLLDPEDLDGVARRLRQESPVSVAA